MGTIYNRRDWTIKDKEKIKELYMKGYSLNKIGRRFGVTGATISNRLKEMGLKK